MGRTAIELFKKNYGFNLKFYFNLKLRFENPALNYSDVTQDYFQLILTRLLMLLGPALSPLKNRVLFSIYMLHVLNLYRGWRYVRNLPIKGQRTWSNAWTAFRCNVLIKPILLKKGRRFYGNLSNSEIYTAYLAEYVNKKWREHWYNDWWYARKMRLYTKKTTKAV